MSFELLEIKDFVQHIVEAFATVIKIDIMIFDLHRNIIAGTGDTKCKVGEQFHHGSLTGRVLSDGKPVFARETGKSEECLECGNYGKCPEFTSVMAYPIIVGSEILGSFCLVTTKEAQKFIILKDEKILVDFLDKLCALIGNTVSERLVQRNLSVLLKRYNNVINTVPEGIIAVDADNNIIHLNHPALKLLGLSEDQVLYKPISYLFPDLTLHYVDEHPIETELTYTIPNRGKKRHYWAIIVPMLSTTNEHLGANVSLRDLSDAHSYANKLMGNYSTYTFDDIQGSSDSLAQVKLKVKKAALTNSTILIRGESGTGKELFAHSIHAISHRAPKNFVAINCSAIPDSLLESELFGYEEGAFTGAKKGGKPGKFELANGGSIFLDEIGDMPLHLQSKLLRVLETRVIERVGGRDPLTIDVRIIAATHCDLEKMVEDHEFRDDLYYRLSVIPIDIAPLRERKEDIPILINFFLGKFSDKLDRPVQTLDDKCRKLLLNYSWPGNIRELQNTIEYAINMTETDQIITTEFLPNRIVQNCLISTKSIKPTSEHSRENSPNDKGKLKEMEIEAIQQVLNRFESTTKGKEMAAKYLGISIATLYRRLKENKLIS